MSDNSFELKTVLNAPPLAVYDALTTEQGIKGWWTPDCEVGSAVGDKSVFRFDDMVDVMRIDALIPGREVRWHVVQQDNHLSDVLGNNTEWVGTDIVFQLSEHEDGGTILHFRHDGLTPDLACYQICNNGWTHFMRTSLPSLLETGHGHPFKAKKTADAG